MQAGDWPSSADDAAIQAALDTVTKHPPKNPHPGVHIPPQHPDPTLGSIVGIPQPILDAVSDLTILYDIYEIVQAILLGLDTIPIVNIVSLIIQIVLQILPMFEGRPREQATLWCAHSLMQSPNPAAVLAGTLITRMFVEWDIVISESGPGEHLVGAVVRQFVQNLVNQGIAEHRAREIVLAQYTTGANQKNFLEPELFKGVPQTLSVYGPQGLQKWMGEVTAHLVKQGQTQKEAGGHAYEIALRQGRIVWLNRIGLGYPLPWTLPSGSGGGGGGGEPPPGGNPPPAGDCKDPCMNMLVESLQQFFSAVTGSGSPLAALAGALPAIVAALQTLDLTNSANALQDLANCICPNLDKISQELATANQLQDVPPAVWNDVIEKMGLPPAFVGQVQGSPWAEVATRLGGMLGTALGAGIDESEFGLKWVFVHVIEPLVQEVQKVGLNFFDSFWQTAGAHVTGLFDQLKPLLQAFFQYAPGEVEFLPQLILTTIDSVVAPLGAITPENADAAGTRILGYAFGVGQLLHLASELAGKLFYPASSVWNHNAQLGVSMLGYDQILAQFHGALFPNMYGIKARYHYQSKYRPILPQAAQAGQAYSRRKITRAQYDQLLAYGGVDPAYAELEAEIAYRPVGAFILRTAFRDRDYPYALAKGLLEDEGYSDANVKLMNDALEFQSNVQIQQRVLLAISSAYAHGGATLDELKQTATQMQWGQLAINAVAQEAVIKRRETMLGKLEAALESAVTDLAMSPDQALSIWQNAGGDPTYLNMFTQVWSVKIATREYTREESVARSTATQTWSKLSTAALEEYTKGASDLAGLTASLTAARVEYFNELTNYGIPVAEQAADRAMSPLIIAAMVADAEARQTLGQTYAYGLLKPKLEADVLKRQVAALLEQHSYSLINTEQLRSNLELLGIPEHIIEDVVAKAAASPTHATKGEVKLPI